MMNPFKKLFQSKKNDKNFKKAGPGQQLTDNGKKSSTVPVARDAAAQAALKRFSADDKPTISSGQKKIQMIAQREIEDERRKCDIEHAINNLEVEAKREIDVREFEHSTAIAEVYYTCELLGDNVCMVKSQLNSAIEEFLLRQLQKEADDLISTAVLLLYSVNTSTAKNAAVETIAKYLQNIIENPIEAKYRRLRITNKAFQERVMPAKGSIHFLKAVGFSEEKQIVTDGHEPETFYVMDAGVVENTEKLVAARETLLKGQCAAIKISRNASIVQLKENERVNVPKLSADFFNLTAEEVKKEQQLKTDEVNRMLRLRTKEMRERDEKLRQYKYKYSLLKIRLPGRYVLQGTFGCYEQMSAVRDFINPYLASNLQGTAWKLKDPMCSSLVFNENETIGALGLAPAAILHFEAE